MLTPLSDVTRRPEENRDGSAQPKVKKEEKTALPVYMEVVEIFEETLKETTEQHELITYDYVLEEEAPPEVSIQPKKRKLSDPSNYAFHCHCGKNFSKNKNLNYHKRKVHNEATESHKIPKKNCPLCDYSTNYHSDMVKHYELSHKIHIYEENLSFLTENEFLKWKAKVETETVSRFIINATSWASAKHKTTKYSCQRSGHYQTRGQGKRLLKKQGSIKINGYCPARMIKQLWTDGSCTVQFTNAHVGHENEVQRLTLSSSEREEIAKKLSMKIPYNEILDEIKDSCVSESTLQRIHLLTRKDLYNIEASYKIQSHKELNIHEWVRQMQNEGDCVVFYKPQGTYFEAWTEINLEDFVLIIMSNPQMEILKRYGKNCICIERTKHDNLLLNNNDDNNFELNTLLVVDELEEAFPCAFLLSNKINVYVLRLFFEQIKLKLQEIVKPKVFMSGMEDEYFDAWANVMDFPEKRIYSTWIVDQSWRENLVKIDGQEIQTSIYKHLRELLTKRDSAAFHNMLIEFITIENSEYLDFINYFRDQFSNNYEYWAYCYTGLNSNTNLERMCKSIHQLYQKGKNGQRLNRAIEAIMRFVRDKVINRLTINNNEKILNKIRKIKLRHKAMKNMHPSTLIQSDDGWEVQYGDETHQIQKQETICTDCLLVCKNCDICLHEFQCSCLDSAIKYNICKHIHFVAKCIKDPNPTEEIVLEMEDESEQVEKNDSLEFHKEELRKFFNEILDRVRNVEEIEVINEALDQINLPLMGRNNSTTQSEYEFLPDAQSDE